MAIVTGESPAAITREAMAAMGGIGRFIAKGDKVMIKPNIGWDRTPELGAGTNPEVVKTLVELCFEAGAKDVTVMDNTTNQAQRCYARSGIAEAAKAAGAKVPFVNPHTLKKMALQGEWLKDWEVFTDFVEVGQAHQRPDRQAPQPVPPEHRHEELARRPSAAPATSSTRSSTRRWSTWPPSSSRRLTVLDAYRILMRNGPQGGRTSDVKLQKTSSSASTRWPRRRWAPASSTCRPEELAYIPLAAARGLGQIDLEKLTR